MLKPLSDRVVAKKEQPAKQTASGFYVPEQEAPAYATVESVGPDVKSVKAGDKIVFKEYSTTNVKIDKDTYIILKEEDILATL